MTAPTAERIREIRSFPDLTFPERTLLAALDHVRAELIEAYIHTPESRPGDRIDQLLAYLAPEPKP